MYTVKYAPWEHYPKKLRHHEVVNPISVLDDFFSVDLLSGHCSKLKNWRYFVLHDKVYNDEQHGPGSLLFTYDINIKLLEAAYLLYYNDSISTVKNTIVSVDELKSERKLWDDFPENLSYKEMHNPYSALKKIFRKMPLQKYRDYLHEWLYAALYIKGGNDELETDEIKLVYRNMLKLYSAAWLIHKRANKSVSL